jgi:hypothetical protein
MPRDSYDSGKKQVGKLGQQPIYQEPADGYDHRPAADVDHVVGGGTYRIGERNYIPTDDREPQESEALRAFWK